MILLSYVPLLTPKLGIVRPPEEKQNLLDMMIDAARAYPIQAVGWMRKTEVESFPVLFMPHAQEIQEHMEDWSGDKPAKYFTLVWQTHGRGYTLVILPDFNKSARRYHAARGTNVPLTILGHLFPYRVDHSVDFEARFLENKSFVDVGFSEKPPKEDGSLEKLSTLKMKVSSFESLSGEERSIVAAHFQIQH